MGNSESLQGQLAGLVESLRVLEAQRAVLGEAIAPAIEAVRSQIAALQAQLSQASAPSEDRRIVSILFSDIVDSTSLAERLDPEEWREIVAAVHGMAGEVVRKRQGAVLQFLGDGLLAAFGIQELSERDSENAIQAALDIQAGLAALQTGSPVKLRVGVHTGLVVVGELGSQAHKEFTASGDAMNVAARLQSAAPPGGVLISEDAYRYVRGVFEVVSQPPLRLKGKSEPIQTYIVLRDKPHGFLNGSRGISGIEVRTVGRQAEFQQIETAFRKVVEDGGFAWVQLLGEPGIGKSRLMADSWKALFPESTEEILVMRARLLQGDERQAFGLIRHIWFDCFQITEDLPLAEAEASWVKGFLALSARGQVQQGDGGGSEEEPAHALGLLVGLPFAESPHIAGLRRDPSQVKGRALVVSKEFLDAIRVRMPVVMLLEDLQWNDNASWDYLMEVFARQPEALPERKGLFVLATARPEWNPPNGLREQAGYMQIDLAPLSDFACRELLLELTQKVAGLPEDVLRMVVERAQGIPYFVEELVNWFLDRGVIERSSEPWRFLPGKLHDSPLPPTLQHLLLTRLNALGASERVALQRGSIYGRRFWEGVLDISESGEILAGLQKRSFVVLQDDSTFHGEVEWIFYHNLQRDTAYESLLIRERKRLHRLAKDWIMERASESDRLEEFAGLIGEHAEKAGETDEAARWFLRAGRDAIARGASLEARRYYERALQYTPPGERDLLWELRLEHAKVVLLLGDSVARQTDEAALLSMAQDSGDDNRMAQALYNQGFSLTKKGDRRAAIRVFQNGLAVSRKAHNRSQEALILGQLVVCYCMLGELSAAEALVPPALESLQSVQDESISATVLSNVSIYYSSSGDYAQASRQVEKQVEIFHRLGDRGNEATSLLNVGYTYLELGQYKSAQLSMKASLRLADLIGSRYTSAYNRLNLSLVHWRERRTDAARKELEQVIPVLTDLHDSFGLAASQTYLGLILEQSQEIGAAQECFTRASQMLEQLAARSSAADAWAGRARCALASGDLEQAQRAGQVVWQFLQETGGGGMELPFLAYQTCVQVFRALGDTVKEIAVLESGYRALMGRSQKISDAEWRKSYLENIPEHRFLVDAGERATGTQ